MISGYLISKIIFECIADNSFSLYAFYLRRIRRIFLALILVLLTALMLTWFTTLSDDFLAISKLVYGTTTFTSNFLLQCESGYFDVVAEAKPLLHLWSLVSEDQFYLLCPILLWLLWRVKKFFRRC